MRTRLLARTLRIGEHHRVPSITAVQPVHVAHYIEDLTRAPTASQMISHLLRHRFGLPMR
jgi:hypothetical protein